MTGALQLVRIEARRSVGLLLFLPMLAVAGFVARSFLPTRLWLWPDTSFAVRGTIILLGPLAAGVAAWMAGRDRRRRMGDLLASTPRPAALRTLSTWAGTALWCAGAYLAVMFVLFGLTAWKATFGGPFLSVVAVGLLAVVTHTALGFAAGHLVPSRFTAPAIAVALFVAQAAPGFAGGPIKYLSPLLDYAHGDVFYGLLRDPSRWQTVWLLGLTGLALSAVALRSQRSRTAGAALLLSLGLTVVGTGALLDTPPSGGWGQHATLIPYQPACQDGPITVCVHPAYAGLLPETADIANRIAAPLLDIPGAPTHVMQRSGYQPEDERAAQPDDMISIYLADAIRPRSGGMRAIAGVIAHELVSSSVLDDADYTDPSPGTHVQRVVISWLGAQAGIELCEQLEFGFSCWGWGSGASWMPETKSHYERFASLEPQTRRAWLEEHYAALRAGRLTLEDLP